MNAFAWSLVVAIFLNSLMAGFLFAFAIVVMPGIEALSDRDYLRSFQAIDRVIQNGQPLFMLMWLGSTGALLVAAVLAILNQGGVERLVVVAAAVASVLLVQLPTMTINIPLNNEVQLLEFDSLDDQTAGRARLAFEARWNRWNAVRTLVSVTILVGLLVVLTRL